jgi:hypothetical protein
VTRSLSLPLQELYTDIYPSTNGKQVYLPESLIESPVFQGSSFDVGESAVVLMNKGKNAGAMKVLKALVGPEHIGKLWSHMLGDKVRSYGICDGVSVWSVRGHVDIGIGKRKEGSWRS